MAYKKCPRCSLNYIKDTDLLCTICLEEVGKAIRRSDEEEEEYDICPECGDQIIKSGEEMCYTCMLEQSKDEVEPMKDKETDWDKASVDDDEELFVEDENQGMIEIDLEEEAEADEDDLDDLDIEDEE
jgi:DNA-directed RNA polymerase subunit RPC12/RpoP